MRSTTLSSAGGSATASSCSASSSSAFRSRSTSPRDAQSRPLAGDLRAAELVARRGAHPRLARAGADRRARREDDYTEQHTRRVALLAVQVGESSGSRRAGCARSPRAGSLHDIGKLSVPDAILKKPGR